MRLQKEIVSLTFSFAQHIYFIGGILKLFAPIYSQKYLDAPLLIDKGNYEIHILRLLPGSVLIKEDYTGSWNI